MSPGLAPLIEAIAARIDNEGRWCLKTDEILGLTGLTRLDYSRVVYGLRGRLQTTVATEAFCEADTGELVTILERFFPQAEQELRAAGLFLPWPDRTELLEVLLSHIGAAAFRHTVQAGTFLAMLRAFHRFDLAWEAYLEEFLPLGPLVDEAVSCFAAGRPALAARTALAFLRLPAVRLSLGEGRLFYRIREEIAWLARANGFMGGPRPDRAEDSGTERPEEQDRHLDKALLVMGLRRESLTVETLKARYRQLVRQYHPDLNPQGLERCTEINLAYALLSANLA